ncbi:hypothetical protein P691DRAFT_674661 [Macrolepiota fuliginosa MF-IS2]|uniref:Uncharacterized protein n=1 Tax=Macrolepiota fuliginosa MF-IS2 TaxID=1400762 RepID=A0A9P6C1U9_9AGAR|nr:hypothetical protein P691DRAFT_674661 [Macrolepiota fuliginosa MF-IS2]
MMNVLKTPSFFRPISRPSSPAPTPPLPLRSESAPAPGVDRTARPLSKLGLSTFRRPSPSSVAPTQTMPTLLIQDGSYLEMLSLKLSEAVSRALAQPPGPTLPYELVAGKRPIPQGRGHALGALIASELKANQDKPHLYRAILRSLHRPLSVLLTNLSAHLLPLLASPLFHSPAAPTVQNQNPNPTQLHALAIATFAQELLETFDDIGLGLDADPRDDGLKPIRKGLASVINRIVGPLVDGIRNELVPVIEALETPNTSQFKAVTGTRAHTIYHPSIVTLQTLMPIYAKTLARYTAPATSHTIIATFLIAVVWKGLVALSNRPFVASAPPSPDLTSNRKLPAYNTPVTPPASRFTLKLPPSRPPSPPMVTVPANASADAQALFDLLNTLPRPSGDKGSSRLATEAVDEAFEALKALSALLGVIHSKSNHDRMMDDMAREINTLTKNIPLLVALPALLHTYADPRLTSVTNLLGLSESEYRSVCLSGIGRAEECAPVIAHRVMDVLRRHVPHGIIYGWLQLETTDLDAEQ